jgi:integrase
MVKQVNKLSALKVSRLTAPGMYGDGGGLWLQVKGPTARSWIYRYTLRGRARWMGLGSVEVLTLAAARQKRDDERQKIKSGIDPVGIARDADRAAREAADIRVITFADAVETYIEQNQGSWRSLKHRKQWRATLVTHAFPIIGRLPLTAITAAHVLEILRPLWTEKNETARRVRGRIEAVLDYAANPDDLAYRNPAKLTPEQLKKKLPRLPASRRPKHHAAMAYRDIGTFMSELAQREGGGARALEFLILTATRTSETLVARWSEIDLAGKVWTIPGDRMKGGKTHRVPLSGSALAVLAKMQVVREGDLVFTGTKAGRPLSNMTLLAVLRRLGRGDLTVHGFRSTFRDWCGERANVLREVAEASLAHVIPNATEAAYARSDLLERRRPVMEMWAKYCGDDLGTANVIPMRNSELLG